MECPRILKLDRLRLRGPNGARDEFLLADSTGHPVNFRQRLSVYINDDVARYLSLADRGHEALFVEARIDAAYGAPTRVCRDRRVGTARQRHAVLLSGSEPQLRPTTDIRPQVRAFRRSRSPASDHPHGGRFVWPGTGVRQCPVLGFGHPMQSKSVAAGPPRALLASMGAVILPWR